MAQQNREHFHVHSENKAKAYEKKKKATNTIKELLQNFSKRDLIEIIERESE
tara:strand:- start:613 stop:768 length:156 start_codon:yes stop_codon:yes gene_type:complete